MRVVEAGHVYELHNVDTHHRESDWVQTIAFVRRRGPDGRLLRDGEHAGILGQELLRVLIDRTLYLNAEAPCPENIETVDKLRECLRLYESRAARRTIEKLPMPEMQGVCARCHHILCLCSNDDVGPRLEHGIER